MYLRFLTIFVVVMTLAFAAFGQSAPVVAAPQQAYLIGPGDEVTGKVLGESQFDFVATVDENGKIVLKEEPKPQAQGATNGN